MASGAPAAAQQSPALPNPALTPGAVVTSDPSEICRPGYAARRPRLYQTDREAYYRQRDAVFAAYGIDPAQHAEFEIDHLIPRCLGGADAAANLWPQKLDAAHRKDEIERAVCRRTCFSPSREAVERQQHWFATGGWSLPGRPPEVRGE